MKKVGIIMGSKSDWKVMKEACLILDHFGVEYSKDIVSAHRTPDRLYEFAKEAKGNGYDLIIAGAGGAAHLPGMVAALTVLPVIAVPIKSSKLNGIDSLLSIVQMPSGVPVASMAIDGAKNAALFAVSILALSSETIYKEYKKYRKDQTNNILNNQELVL